jgi:hypothetical protein
LTVYLLGGIITPQSKNKGNKQMNIPTKFDRIVATQLKNGKYRFEAVEPNGTKHVIRKAGNLTKGVVQWKSSMNQVADHFGYNIAEAYAAGASGYVVKVFTPGNGVEVIPFEA